MRRALYGVMSVGLLVLISGYGLSVASAGTSSASSAATSACSAITEGSSSGAAEACAGGYDAAKAGKTEAATCEHVGSGAILTTENVKDCESGWAGADVAGTVTAPTASSAATSACNAITEGSSSGAAEACAQGYDAAKAGKTEEQTCAQVGSGTILTTENIQDCESGWALADVAGTVTAPTASSAATSACNAITEGSSSGAAEACAQGYDAAKAGKTEEQTCAQVGSGTILTTENVKDCRSGWVAG